jgi:hypothetical protein
MKPAHLVLLLAAAAALVFLVGRLSGAWRPGLRDAPRVEDSGPASVIQPAVVDARQAALAPAAGEATRARNSQLALEIERGLVARDPRQRETALAVLLPELLQSEPARAAVMVARQQPGEARDTLRHEVARLWIRQDREAAVEWMKSLGDEAERRDCARVAVASLAAVAPGQAIYVADQFGVGRDDGYLEHLVQTWAEADLDAALRWLETQPDDARTAPLRARIELVRERNQAGRG